MSNTNRGQVSYVAESVFGTTPSAALQLMRLTGETLSQESDYKESDEIVPDGQVAEIVRTGYRAGGDISFEMSFGVPDAFMVGILRSAGWSSPVTVTGTDISLATADNSINSVANAFGSIVANQWIKVTGFVAGAVYNGYYKVTSKPSNGKLILAGRVIAGNVAAGDSVTVKMGAQIVNGTTESSFSFERKNLDLSNVFQAYKGMTPATMELSAIIQQVLSGKVSFLGRAETNASATIGNGSYTAAPTATIMNAADNLLSIMTTLEAAALGDYPSTEFTCKIDDRVRARMQLGDGGPVSVGQGSLGVTGTLKIYHGGNTAYANYLNDTYVAMAEVMEDALGNAYLIDLPRVKLKKAMRNMTAKDSDIYGDFDWQAAKHPGEGITIRIVRFP